MSDQQASTDEQLQGSTDVIEETKVETATDAGIDSQEAAASASETVEGQSEPEGEKAEAEVIESGAEKVPADAAPADVTEPEFITEPDSAAPADVTTDSPVEDTAKLNLGVQDNSIQTLAAAAAPEVIAPAPVVETPVTPKATEGTSENKEYLDNIRENGTLIQKQAIEVLDLFCSRMRPRAPITAAHAMEAQRDLLDFITVLLRKDYEDFRKGWATMLVYFAEFHGDRPTAKDYTPLSEYSTSRHLDSWKDEERASAYNNLLTLLRITRNGATRKQDVKRVRLDAIAPTFLNARCMDNLQRFYA